MTIEKRIEDILNTPFWLKGIDTETRYFRTQDDCDGDMLSGMSVSFSPDGDAWIDTTTNYGSCRFRMPGGGGLSPRTRVALMILAKAIKMDEESGKDWPPKLPETFYCEPCGVDHADWEMGAEGNKFCGKCGGYAFEQQNIGTCGFEVTGSDDHFFGSRFAFALDAITPKLVDKLRLQTKMCTGSNAECREHFHGFDLRLTNRSIRGVTLTGFSRMQAQNNQFPPFLLAEEEAALGCI